MTPLRKLQQTRRAFDQVRRSTCANCPCGCGVNVYLRDQRLVEIFGDDEHPVNKGSFCPKGLTTCWQVAHPDRLTSPLVRESAAQPFRRVPWEQAIQFVAERLRDAAHQRGPEGCRVYARPGSSFGYLLGGTVFAGQFGTRYGPWRFLPRASGEGGSLERMFGVAASRSFMNTPRDWCNSRCIVVVGCDPATQDPMAIGPIIDARDRGTSVVVIDTRTTMTAIKSSYSLRVLPGTLGVALRGILRVLLDEKLVDREFIEGATSGVSALQEELASYTADRVARRCAVDEAELRRIARLIGTAFPMQVVSGGSLAMEELTDDELRLCGALVSLRGSVGVPGGGLNLLNATPFDPREWLQAEHRALTGGESLSLAEALLREGGSGGAWFFEGDAIARLTGGEAALAGLSAAPLVVALSSFLDHTTRYSHAVFPMASWLESDGLLANGNGRALQWHSRILPLPGECRTALDFWTDLAGAYGGSLPWQDVEAAQRNRAAADWALSRNPWTRAIDVSVLDPERNPPGGVLWPCIDRAELAFENTRLVRGDVRGKNILFQRNRPFPLSDRRFPTADGRIALGAPLTSTGENAEPSEDSTQLWLVASPAVDHVESCSGQISDRASQEAEAVLYVHPHAAAAAGLGNGELAVIENSRGAFRGRICVSEVVAPQVIWCMVTPGPSRGDGALNSPWLLFPSSAEPGIRSGTARVSLRRPSISEDCAN